MIAEGVNVEDMAEGDGWVAYCGDSVEVMRGIPEASVGLSVFSPPFGNLYIYSDSDRDMGNSADDAEFLEHYSHVARELYRVTKPGRVCAVHCKDLVDYKGRDGRAGLRDFPGDLIRVHEAAGWKYHSRVTVDRCPVHEMTKTKAHGLLYKQLRADSTFSRQGLPEYILLFRKWAAEDEGVEPVSHTKESFPLPQWQEWARPTWKALPARFDPEVPQNWQAPLKWESPFIWYDDDAKDVLNVAIAREDGDEKHMCPLPLGLIRRCVTLWSNAGDVVLSPFGGVGSEGYVSLQLGRKAVIVELKRSYWQRACRYLDDATRQLDLFGAFGA